MAAAQSTVYWYIDNDEINIELWYILVMDETTCARETTITLFVIHVQNWLIGYITAYLSLFLFVAFKHDVLYLWTTSNV